MTQKIPTTAVALSKSLSSGEITAQSIIENTFSQIEKQDSQINAFLSLRKEKALAQAAQIDAQRKAGNPLPPFAGVPIAIKDNIHIEGDKTTCASRMLENFVAPFHATVTEKLLAQGLIPIGKTNLDEFAMGSSTENSAFCVTRNPANPDYVAGGSSGGSAAAVGAGYAPFSLGSDTGGSIRQPAAFCGLLGLKPTYGRVSRYGLVAFASSLDQIGPFAQTAEDAAHLLNIIAGPDPKDATSYETEIPDFTTQLNNDIKGLKIGVPKELMGDAIQPDIVKSIRAALELLSKNGAVVEEISMDAINYAVATYYVIAPCEASANLARFDGVRYTQRSKDVKTLREMYRKTRGEFFGKEVQRRIVIGTYALSSGYYDAYYLRAQKAREYITRQFNEAFQKFDVVLTPTTPTTAFKPGAIKDPVEMYLADLATIPANMAGLPALSVPCGTDANNLPIGMQLIGKHWDEAKILNIAHIFEQLRGGSR